jgi:hypothetical protein
MNLLGLTPNSEDALKLTKGLKNLRTGDLFELKLSEEMEEKMIDVENNINRQSPK